MKFLHLEHVIKKLTGNDGKYANTAGIFERILRNQKTSPEEKAEKIAELLEYGICGKPE
jgi:hypothetical protein